ncbi:MAG TPA: hypothetical protein PKY05_18920, partial [Fibrobacteria bacterium]|nr:hypothetical protein [Fibrobacteria bacterium]
KLQELAEVLAVSSEALRILLVLVSPVIPNKASEALSLMGESAVAGKLAWGLLPAGRPFADGPVLFPRLEVKKPEPKAAPAPAPKAQPVKDPFEAVDFRIAKIVSAEDHPSAEKLLVLQLDVGELGPRQVCAGIKAYFPAASLPGRKVLLVANLKKAKLRGVESMGMILAADNADGTVHLLEPQGEAGAFATVEGLDHIPGANIGIEAVDPVKLVVRAGRLHYGQKPVSAGGQPVNCSAEDEASVH